MRIRLRATFTEWSWSGEDEEPDTNGGWADIDNPWGGFDAIPPEDLFGDAYRTWCDENVSETVFDDDDPTTLDDGDWVYSGPDDTQGTYRFYTALERAAMFVEGWSGGVWDLWEGESEQNYRTGVYRETTLHLDAEASAWERIIVRGCPTLSGIVTDPRNVVFGEAIRIRAAADRRQRELIEGMR